MTSHRPRVLIVLGVLLATLAACQAPPPVDLLPPAAGVLQVVVHDEQDRPLPGATVAISGCDAPTITDRNGIALACVYASETSVSVHLSGYHDVRVEKVSVPGSSPLRIVLRRR